LLERLFWGVLQTNAIQQRVAPDHVHVGGTAAVRALSDEADEWRKADVDTIDQAVDDEQPLTGLQIQAHVKDDVDVFLEL
jgi:hypothetical protein